MWFRLTLSTSLLNWIQIILLYKLISFGVFGMDKQSRLCPPGCNPDTCAIKVLSCNKISRLPTRLLPGTNKILIFRQDVPTRQQLSLENFTYYAAPIAKIQKITIQSFGIAEISPRTFSRLSYLQVLDLSFNNLSVIQPYTFSDLTLEILRLDGNKGLRLNSNSFSDLSVKSLSLQKCEINSISYSVFEPIYHSLKRLLLSHNHLRILEPRFAGLFHKLDELALTDNRFDCSKCSMQWLVTSMRELWDRNGGKLSSQQKILYPRCYSPPESANRFVHRLTNPDDFQCPSAAVQRISVLLLPNNSATLTCTASHKQSIVAWIYQRTGDILSRDRHSNTHTVHQVDRVDTFACLVKVESASENSSTTRLQISWPPVSVLTPNTVPKTTNYSINWSGNNNNKNNYRIQSPYSPPHNKIGQSPSSADSTDNNSSYFFQPQFSLIEMIAGVVGTFIGTLIIFIAMLRFIFFRVRVFSKHSQFREVMTSGHTANASASAAATAHLYNENSSSSCSNGKYEKRKRYATYEPQVYSDSQTYDIPTLTSPPLASQSSLGHFIDFKTQKTVYNEK